MSAIILTWNNPKRVRIVSDDNGKPVVYDSVQDADAWSWDHADKIAQFMKIVDLDE